MKKGQILEGTIERVDFPNRGIINIEGTRAIVKNGIPGQKVRFSVNKVRSGRCEGRLLEVVEQSPDEQESLCPHFADCGGCTYQNLPYEKQLEMKEGQIRRLLDLVCQDYQFEGIKASPEQYGYRNKMEFSFGDEYKDGPLALGMHKRGSFYDIVTCSSCQIVDEDYRRILQATLEFAQASGQTFYHKVTHQGYFRHLLLRKGKRSGEILIDLITSSQGTQTDVNLQAWVEQLLALPLDGTIAGILHTVNDSVADVVKNDGTEILYGQDYFYEELLGLKFKISPFSFFQTNSLGAEILYETARSYIGDTKDKVIYDLYSGTGTIAQILAPVAAHVTGVEIVEEAVEAARVNASLNQLSNCDFIAGDVLKVLDSLTERPDLIVLDPPRDGIHPKALEKIIRYGVERMVYISCKPTSLVRDLEVLQASGYRVERACAVDLFPGTYHTETVVFLSKLHMN
jgi:23S rRNA (uracil-5-)-methyltransferase RumA